MIEKGRGVDTDTGGTIGDVSRGPAPLGAVPFVALQWRITGASKRRLGPPGNRERQAIPSAGLIKAAVPGSKKPGTCRLSGYDLAMHADVEAFDFRLLVDA
jgi:hypothetical protein